MTKDLLLTIDHGTQSVRALLFDLGGTLLAKTRIPIEPYFSSTPGLAEQDPNLFWQAVCKACQNLWLNPIVDRERIAGVAITTQRSTVINLDKAGEPLRPAIVWLDQRRTENQKPVSGLWGLAFLLTGMTRTAAYLQAEAEANWISTNQPEIWKKTFKYVFLSGYLAWRMTGRFVDSVSCQVGYIPFDYKRQQWSGKFDWKWQAVPMDPAILPELFPAGQILGEVTTEAARATGIPVGLPLVAAAADKACEVIGAGGLTPNIACLSYGTAATINTTHSRYIELIPLIPPYPSAIPGYYSLEMQIFRGYWMVSWFKSEFGHVEAHIAGERKVEPEVIFDEMVNAIPPGSQDLVLQPYWSPGLKLPGPEARGAIIGFGGVHTRAHLYRSILEGLAYALREGALRTEKRSKIKITELRVAGGGSQSNAAMQITADVFGLPASRPHVYEASGLGAAIDSAVGLGLHPDFEVAIKSMTHPGETFQPDPPTHQIYDELFKNVYLKMYHHLQPLYNALDRINNSR